MSSNTPLGSPHIIGVIPARLRSTRLPGKVLLPVAGRPLLAWVVQAAQACPLFGQLIIAVDSEEVAELCRQQGWPYQMTDPALPSGTDRLFAVAQFHPADIYVNIQGDEPLLTPAHFQALLAPFSKPSVQIATLRVLCPPAERNDPNVVKVVTSSSGRALYFSRATLPFTRDAGPSAPVWKHLGLYAYRAEALQRFATLTPSSLERTEQLEQLRLLENDIPLHVADAPADAVGVNTQQELEAVESILRTRGVV